MPVEINRITRRDMLTRSAFAATVAAASSPLSPLFAAAESRRFKLGVCDWSIGQRAKPTALDLAKALRLDGVQIDMEVKGDDVPLRHADQQQAYRDAARRTGVEIASLAISATNGFSFTADPRVPGWVDTGIDICKSLNLPVLLLAFFAKSDLDMGNKAQIDGVAGILKPAAAKAEKMGVALGLENYLSAEDNMRLIDRIGSPAAKVYYDVGNSTDKGRDIFKEIRLLGKQICEMHAKDGGHVLGKGRIDFKKVRQALDDINYSGWIQVEGSAPNGFKVDYPQNVKYLRELFPPQS